MRRDPLESIALEDPQAKSAVWLAPRRGGMATRFTIDGRPVFYLDEATLRDETKNVRGGNPVLFPSPGKLTNDAWSHLGTTYAMKQHGFARNLPWSVEDLGDASVTLRLESSDVTRAQWPWDFVAEYRYSLTGRTLRIDQRFENRSPTAMRFGAGFHPYFFVPQRDKGHSRVETGATRAFDNVSKTDVAAEIDLTAKEVDLHLHDHGARPCRLVSPSGTITVSGSPEMDHWVIWTLEGKDFVCVEPWTSPGDALGRGDRLLTVEPGSSRSIWIAITA